jgi:hypothetical protein
MTLRPLALGLALLLPATSGCGVMQFVEDIDETHVNALPLDDRPTVLVRLERGEDGEDLLASFHAPFSLPLFASVAYQQGTEHMSTRADYVLDMSVREGKPDINAYSVVAACTLGALPIPLWEEYRATTL